ncbi:MAG: ABC transporter permease [Parachlamydiaceae bacterium]|nr:ABC transporter permease [Parachlamydiaceae bacterium]
MWTRIRALIIKELLAVWRDPRSRIVLIVPPIVQLFIFAFAATLEVKNVTIGILNRDNGEQGIELVQRFNGSPTFTQIYFLKSVEEITPFIDNQKGVMVLSIDEQFSRNLDAKNTASVQLIFDGRRSNSTQIVGGYAATIIDQFANDVSSKKNIPIQRTELFPRNWFNPNLLYYWYNVPCLVGILTMLTGLIVSSLSIAREREMGTFDQLLVSPMLPIEILIGKSLPAILIGIAEGSIILTVGVFILNVPFTGSLLMLYFSLFVFVCAAIGVGLFISALCSTQQQAILGTYVFMSPSILLSGFATPIENMPWWLQAITYLNPLRYILVILKGSFLKAMPPHVILSNLWPIAIIAIVTLTASSWFFRRKLE